MEEQLHSDSKYVTVYVTADSDDEAVHISTSLVKERLVACANIQSGTRSIYEWGGVLQLENEVTIIMKAERAMVDAIITRVKEIHTFEVPCITVLPIIAANPDYLKWISSQTSKEKHKTVEGHH